MELLTKVHPDHPGPTTGRELINHVCVDFPAFPLPLFLFLVICSYRCCTWVYVISSEWRSAPGEVKGIFQASRHDSGDRHLDFPSPEH